MIQWILCEANGHLASVSLGGSLLKIKFPRLALFGFSDTLDLSSYSLSMLHTSNPSYTDSWLNTQSGDPSPRFML